PLARLSDRAESRDVHRDRRRGGEFPRRHAVRRARSAYPVLVMATLTERRVDLTREGFWSRTGFLIRRYPLGAAGALIMVVFVLAAAFAPWITEFDPLSTNARLSLAPPTAAHWMGADFMGRDMY